MAGSRRSLTRQRRRLGPMLPTGIPSLALISTYGTGGSSVRRAINCWQNGGKPLSAPRSAACRSAASSSSSTVATCSSEVFSALGACPASCRPRAARRTRTHSRRAVVASQPGSAAGSRTLSSWSTRCSQTLWPTSSASALRSSYLRQIDQISGAYRPTSASHACLSPFRARLTRSVTTPSWHSIAAREIGGRGRFVAVISSAVMIWFPSGVPLRHVPLSAASRVLTTRNGPHDNPQESVFRHSYLGTVPCAGRETQTVRN